MKIRIERIAAIVMVLACIAQVARSQGSNGVILYASDFAQWSLPQGTGPANGTISWPDASICRVTSAGYNFTAPKINRPLRIVDNASPTHSEIVIPSNVIVGPGGCSVTATMLYKHLSYSVWSGTAGLQEAIDYQAGLPQGALVTMTPDWTRAGGTTGMIDNAYGTYPVTLSDQRISTFSAYAWNGSHYVLVATMGGGGSGVSQIVAGTNITLSPSGGTGVVTVNSTGGGSGVPSVSAVSPIRVNGGDGPVTGPATVDCPTCGEASFTIQPTPPIAGNYVILPAVSTCSGGSISATCSIASGSLSFNVPASPNVFYLYDTYYNMQAPALPSFVDPATITAVYAVGYLSVVGLPKYLVLNSCWGSTTGSHTRLLGTDASSLTICGISGYAASQNSPGFGVGFNLDYYVYYTGTAPPVTGTFIAPPLTFANNTLGLQVPYDWAPDMGSVNAVSLNLPGFLWIAQGDEVKFFPAANNTSTTPTISLNTFGTQTIVKAVSGSLVPLALNDLSTTEMAVAIFDGTYWELQNPATGGGGGSSLHLCAQPNAIQAANSGATDLTCDAGITINPTAHTLSVGTTPAHGVTIAALSTPTDWTLDTTTAATACASLGCSGGSYTLPIAQPSTLGGIKPDNTTITVNPSTGVASATGGGGGATPVTVSGTNVNEIDVTSCITSSYDDYQFRFDGLTVTAGSGVTWLIQFSANYGVTWDTGANYSTGRLFERIGSNYSSSDGSTGTGISADLGTSGTWAPGNTVSGDLVIYTKTSVGNTDFNAHFQTKRDDGNRYNMSGGGNYTGSGVNALRLIIGSGGTFTGSITCQPLAK